MSAEEEAQRRSAAEKLLRMPAELAGEIIIKGIECRKPRVLVGTDAKIASFIERLAPVSYWKVLEQLKPRT